ncbi:MAG: ATP-binding protein, partial [Limnobacter sp.]|nr:ATP-binding protein [Limnobacter sp.]
RGRVQIIETCLDGLSFSWIVDPDGEIQFSTVGQNFNRFFRLDRTDFLEDWSLMLPEVHSKDRKALELFLSRFDAFPAKESLIFEMARAAHESNRFLQITVRREMGHKQMRVFGVVVDVTELMMAKKQAETEFRVKADFLATVSHELRTPLNSIIGFSKILTSQLGNEPELQQDASNIVLAGESLHVILNDILDYNRIQAEGIRLDNQPFDLAELLGNVYKLNKPIADQKGIGFKLVNRTVDSPLLLGDANRLRQVFQNLVSNALKFTEEGHVEIRVYGSEPSNGRMQLVVEVEDTGVGIGRAEMRRLFKPFSQASREVNRRYGGTGLGLAISSGLVERMGGNIDVTSEPNVGSVFAVQLNLALSRQKQTTKDEQQASTEPIHILAVDDHPLNLKLLDRFLKKAGHTVKMAESGQEAVDLANAEKFDLILMD